MFSSDERSVAAHPADASDALKANDARGVDVGVGVGVGVGVVGVGVGVALGLGVGAGVGVVVVVEYSFPENNYCRSPETVPRSLAATPASFSV